MVHFYSVCGINGIYEFTCLLSVYINTSFVGVISSYMSAKQVGCRLTE